MTKIKLEHARGVSAYLLVNPDNPDQSVLVQTDWDYPSVASNFAFSLRSVQSDPLPRHWKTGEEFHCQHDSTDGTVTCQACGLTASVFISSAQEFLENNIGAIADDPGYFS